ncbi:MAG: hypothetical protein ACREPY_15915 [Rhodanobacteraceae bacterium]
MKKLLVVGITCAMASGLSFAAFAQTHSAQDEITTAHAHAVLASTADTVEIGHTHLHHVINCLVGPKGSGFDAKAADPCKGQGNGAIPDSASNHAVHRKLKKALAEAQSGLKANELATIHSDAGKLAAKLKSADGSDSAKASSGW